MGKDVARRLGYINHRKALRDHVDEEDRKDGVTIRDSIGRDQEAAFINESGLYSLVLASKLPQAKAFKRWVTSEVLPQIRKTGGYIPLKDQEGRELTDLEIMCRAMMIMKKSIEQKEQLIADLQPKADYVDEVLDSVDCLTMTKGYGNDGTRPDHTTAAGRYHLRAERTVYALRSLCTPWSRHLSHAHTSRHHGNRSHTYLSGMDGERKKIH